MFLPQPPPLKSTAMQSRLQSRPQSRPQRRSWRLELPLAELPRCATSALAPARTAHVVTVVVYHFYLLTHVVPQQLQHLSV